MVHVTIEKIHPDAVIPQYATPGSVGVDLVYPYDPDITIDPHETTLVKVGFRIALPPGYELQIRGRSGLGLKNSISIVQGIGTVDHDYHQEIGVILHNNHPLNSFIVTKGMRVAQALVMPVPKIVWDEKPLDVKSHRGGFGSSGTHGLKSSLEKKLGLDDIKPEVDRSQITLADGSPITPDHRDLRNDGQQKAYVVLSDEERAKGFVRPLRKTYKHLTCGTTTTMGQSIAETYSRDPLFYTGTFCVYCGRHFPVGPLGEFVWDGTNDKVGT